MMTKRQILIDNKERIEKLNDFVQLHNKYGYDLSSEDISLILKTLIDLLEGAINRAKE